MSSIGEISKTRPIEIIKWNPQGIWTFDSTETSCGICKNELTCACATCLLNSKNIDCKVIKGKCEHVFHKHCIDQWRIKSSICPICTTPWINDIEHLNMKNVQWSLSKK